MAAARAVAVTGERERAEEMSDQAAMRDERTMRAKEANVSPLTEPPNQITSP